MSFFCTVFSKMQGITKRSEKVESLLQACYTLMEDLHEDSSCGQAFRAALRQTDFSEERLNLLKKHASNDALSLAFANADSLKPHTDRLKEYRYFIRAGLTDGLKKAVQMPQMIAPEYGIGVPKDYYYQAIANIPKIMREVEHNIRLLCAEHLPTEMDSALAKIEDLIIPLAEDIIQEEAPSYAPSQHISADHLTPIPAEEWRAAYA